MRPIMCLLIAGVIWGGAAAQEVYQELDEATGRIARLSAKPYDKLIDADGYYQSETLIFKDVVTGREIWSLTQEACIDTANVERRMVYSCDGSVMSMKGNRVYRELDGVSLHFTSWTGHNFLMNADLTKRRKLWVNNDGSIQQMNNKFDTWDRQRPRTLYYTVGNKLYRVTVDRDAGLYDNVAEEMYTFPNSTAKFIQTINDDNVLCIQDENGSSMADDPLFYVIDLRLDPCDPDFCRYHGMQYGITGVPGHDPNNEYHVHVIGVGRGSDKVSWNYGPMTSPGESVHFSVPIDALDATPTWWDASNDPWGQYIGHPGTGFDGRKAYFSGPTTPPSDPQGWGIWVRLVGQAPVYTNVPAAGGHATWCGNDPDWYFANISRRDPPWSDLDGKIVAGNADGSEPIMLCEPYDRHRGGTEVWDGIPRPNQSPDATKCWYHSSMLMPDDSYAGSYIVVFRRPHPPISLSYAGGQITFTAHAVSQEVKSYLLYRMGESGWQYVQEIPASAGGCAVSQPGTYMMTALEWSGLESDVSSPTIEVPSGAAGDPVTGWDTTAPGPPTGLNAVAEEPGQYRLSWTAPADQDVRYYNLYFSAVGHPRTEQQRRFASPPAGTSEYLDWSAPTSGEAYYAVTAVDRQGNESMPARFPTPAYHTLTVNSGSGDGSYFQGWVVQIAADPPAGGQTFDRWTGDTAGIVDVDAAATTLIMPDAPVAVTATYGQAFALTVTDGSGGGLYVSGKVVAISADDPPAGQMFSAWIGDVGGIADVNAADTTLTMPAADATVTAAMVPIPGRTLIADFGDPAENDVFGFEDWTDLYLGLYTSRSADGPEGIKGGWTGKHHCMAVSGSSQSFAQGDQIVVTWYNTESSPTTFSPKISFDDPDSYGQGTEGTWYDMAEVIAAGHDTAVSTYVVSAEVAGEYSLVNVCRSTDGANSMLCDKIELVGNQPPIAADDAYEVSFATTLTVSAPGVLGNDLDGEHDLLTAVKTSDPAHGQLILNGDGSFTYAPDAGYAGQDGFTYVANDGEFDSGTANVTITVTLAGDLDVNGFVGQGDLDLILDNWGMHVPPADPRADPSGDGLVSQVDLDYVLCDWGLGASP